MSSNFIYIGTPHVTTSIDQQSTFLISNEILQKLHSINYLNEIYEKVRSNDKIFTEKISSLLTDIDKENEINPKQSSTSLTLQSQVMLARNLAHTLNNNEQIKSK